MRPRAAVFLDRDGTMIEDVGYLRRLADLVWVPGAIAAIHRLNEGGVLVCVTTNQRGIALGYLQASFVDETHRAMAVDLAAGGAHVDGWYVCPHAEAVGADALGTACDCRKPKAGLIHQATREFAIDLGRSWVVGDKKSDLAMGAVAGVRGVLVRTGVGAIELARNRGTMPGAEHVADDLAGAVDWILQERDVVKERP